MSSCWGPFIFMRLGLRGKKSVIREGGGGWIPNQKMESDGPKAIQKYRMVILPIQINL